LNDNLDDLIENLTCPTLPDDTSKLRMLSESQILDDLDLNLEALFKRHFEEIKHLNL
jgi:hypothetical protein